MEQYIPKSALVAEIKRRLKFVEKRLKRNNSYTEEGNTAWKRDKALYDAHNFLLSSLDTLEVQEVDFHKELLSFYRHTNDSGSAIALAKHFFELGLKAQKGE